MLDACDPNADIENLRQLIKLNTGVNIKLTKSQICQAYDEIQEGKLPLPPLVMSSDRTYLVDKKSPLKPKDYELLFDATTKRADLKRIARKVGLKQVEQKTKSQIVDAIGKRLRYMKIHEPVKFARQAQISVNRNTAVNNTAVNVNVNTTNINRVNTNINRVNTNVNRVNTNVNRVNTNVNRVNTNVNRVNTNVNRVNTNRVNRPKNSKLSLPSGGLFMRGAQPKFLGGTTNAVKQPKEKRGFFASLFGKKENKNFIASNKFKESKEGYVFRKGEKGLGYYLNTGRIQGPEIPSANTIQPSLTNGRTGNNISLDLATAQIKQLGLKREQKFLSKLEAGGVQRKRVIAEAEQAKQEENELLSFLGGLNLNNTNRNTFVRRMTTDDFKQIKSEAQIKAGKNGMTNEQKMSTFLESLTINNASKNSFMSRVREEGANVNALIEEAKSLASNQKNARISKKKEEFQAMIANLKLNNSDKIELMNQIENTTNLNTMKNRAQKRVEERMAEKKEQIANNLASFLTPLKINQSNKNTFLRRFKNENANINSIKNEARALELRVRLKTTLGEIGINQRNQNSIMKKFNNGNRNFNRLVEEARNIKNTSVISNKKQKLLEVLNKTKLSNVNKDSFINRLNNKNANMNTIIKEIKALNTVLQQKENQKTLNRKTLKEYLDSMSLSNDVKANIQRRFNSNEANLNTLRGEINGLIKKAKNTKLAENKQKFVTNIKSTILSANQQNVFIRRLNTNNVNIPSMRKEVNAMVAQMIEKQRSRERYKLEEYMKTIGLSNENRISILGKFDANNKLTVQNIKNEANAMLQLRKQEQRGTDKDILSVHAKKLGLPQQNINSLVSQLNRETLNSLMAKANQMSKNLHDELYQYLNTLNMNVPNRNAIMNKFKARIATVNQLKTEAREIHEKRRSEKKSSLSEFLDTLELSNSNKRVILNRFNTNQSVSLNALRTNAAKLVQQRKNKKQLASRLELSKNLKNLGLSNTEVDAMLKRFNNKNATADTIRNEASKLAQQKLVEHLNTLNLSESNKNKILSNFKNNVANLNTLKNRASQISAQRKANAKKMQNLIQAKSVSNKKDRLRDYMKNTRLTNTNKQSFINRVEVDTNIETIKREIQELNTVLKGKNTELARKKSELSIYLNGLSNLTPDERTMLMKKVVNANTNINSIKNEGQRLNQSVKNKRTRNQTTKNVASKLQSLTNLGRENRKRFMNRLATNDANTVLANATALNQQRKSNREQKKAEEEARRLAMEEEKRKANEERRTKNQITKNVASKLQSLTNLERANRKRFMNRLPTNGANTVIANATALNQQRKNNREQKKADEDARRKALENNKRRANEERRAKNQITKNVASKLQSLTNLERANRKRFMNRLPTNGANTVIANATALNQRRKNNREQKRADEEAKRLAMEE